VTIRRIFLTGGAGFVGRLLRQELDRAGYEVVALDRSGRIARDAGNARVVRGDLLDPSTYRDALAGCDAVVHLAAATGTATAERHVEDTARGTETILGASRETGVSRFLLVSSIAASFPDKRDYPYAQAKEQAERAARDSGIRHAILRPTIILGENAPLAKSLASLAMLPAILLPGSSTVRVQPIDVRDTVAAILAVLAEDRFRNETFEIGGPEVLTMEELLQRIRQARTGRRGRVLRIPVWFFQLPLRLAESSGLGKLLPVTAGQFSSFKQDGVATPNVLQADLAPPRVTVAGMIAMAPARQDDALDRECRVFTKHLVGANPDELVMASYRRAVASLPALAATSAWDRALLSVARGGTIGARCADAHAALFARSSTLRKRLVMLLAILESRSPYAEYIDKPLGGTPAGAIVRLGVRGVVALIGLLAGTLLLLPVRAVAALRGDQAG
jgi:NADH dehydrogenase